MKRRSYKLFIKLSVIAVVLAALAIPCAAVERPFRLEGTTLVLGNPFAPEGAQMKGAGQATHLGNWVNEGAIFFDASSGPPFSATAIVHFTAANGDKLDIILAGQIDLSGVATATYHIVGGTGRFANASGTGGFTAQPNVDGSLRYTADGVINY